MCKCDTNKSNGPKDKEEINSKGLSYYYLIRLILLIKCLPNFLQTYLLHKTTIVLKLERGAGKGPAMLMEYSQNA